MLNVKLTFVFIIDEINRGEVSKIFGELFYAIDPGYRGKKEKAVQTQYQNLIHDGEAFKDGFYVPENVYIIGTMNDIDRSVESIDFAFRRRFTWTDEMDMLYGDKDYACVNIMAQTMCPGGKKRTEPTHLYLYKELFTRSDNSGYYSFKFASRNGAGNREQLFIWSDAYIAMTGLTISYKIVTDNRTTPLATSQVDIQEMSEF